VEHRNDIVNRLRRVAAMDSGTVDPTRILLDAANEILILRAELERYHNLERGLRTDTTEKCIHCNGTGLVAPAHDLLLRPPKEQAEYMESIRNMPKHKCGVCNGTGKVQ